MSDENKEPNKYKEEAKALAKKELARRAIGGVKPCLLYTSDAADE